MGGKSILAAYELSKVDRNAPTLRELTLEKVREAIFQGYFKPGSRLVERTLCDLLGVSRTVVREVLRQLEAEGLVGNVPHQGPVVAVLDAAKVREIYEIRALLEAHAARACAEQADEATFVRLKEIRVVIEQAFEQADFSRVLEYTGRFYETMFVGGGKHVTLEIVNSLNARINRLRFRTISAPHRRDESNREMRALMDALLRRDGQAAFEACMAHVERAAQVALDSIAQETAQPGE